MPVAAFLNQKGGSGKTTLSKMTKTAIWSGSVMQTYRGEAGRSNESAFDESYPEDGSCRQSC